MKDNKPWYEKIGVWIGIVASICTILAFVYSLLNTSSTSNTNKAITDNIKMDNGNNSIIIHGDNNGDINLNIDTSLETTTSISNPDSNDVDISTPTTTSSEKESPAIVKNSDLVLPPNPVKTNIEINLEIYSSTYPEEEIGNYSSDKEKELLREAKKLCESKNYDEAITIYVCDVLKDNPYAKINLGYLYAHGYGYEEDVETALKIYDSVDMDIAKRNKLALLITANSEGIYDAEIVRLIYYFTEKRDYNVQNYITNCIYNKNVELLTDEERNITCYLKDLYVLKLTDKISSTRTYSLDRAYEKLIYGGLSYKNNWQNGSFSASAYYSYNVYQYNYLDWLEKIYA